MTTRQQQPGETREAYVRAAAAYARGHFNRLLDTPEYRHAHESHAVAKALELTEERFSDLGTFGTEGDCEANGEDHHDIQYLNAGDTYDLTVVYWRGRFRATTWGDCIESAQR
jgi:hypothetical protein